jgi:hypothetical protein
MGTAEELEKLEQEKEQNKEVDKSMAKKDPENYWIDPKDGNCKKRGTTQFLDPSGCRITEKEFNERLNRAGRLRYTKKRNPTNPYNVSVI